MTQHLTITTSIDTTDQNDVPASISISHAEDMPADASAKLTIDDRTFEINRDMAEELADALYDYIRELPRAPRKNANAPRPVPGSLTFLNGEKFYSTQAADFTIKDDKIVVEKIDESVFPEGVTYATISVDFVCTMLDPQTWQQNEIVSTMNLTISLANNQKVDDLMPLTMTPELS